MRPVSAMQGAFQVSDRPTVSVIVPTIHARPDLLQTCLDSVAATLQPGDELLVVEGGTFAENCNAGAADATGAILLFLNDDTKVDQDDWLDVLCGPFADPQVGVAGCRLIYPNGHIQHSGVYFEVVDGLLNAVNRTWDAESGFIDAVTGACMAVRASVFQELSGFDVEYRNGLEDVDLCLRTLSAGYRIYYENEVTLIHHESQSGPMRWAWCQENIQRFAGEWRVGETGGDSEDVE